MSSLDDAIAHALQLLANKPARSAFDYEKYIAAFRQSAQNKAKATLRELDSATSPFSGLCPVFISIGGGDGEELLHLLKNSKAKRGILLEGSRALADKARRREREASPKEIIVIEGDAQTHIGEAVFEAEQCIENGTAQCIAVTAHAVIHELFDRGANVFDPLAFFGTIFSTDYPTWFTYREPAVPDAWPERVLLSANCRVQSLLSLAEAIRSHHPALRLLNPPPAKIGDHVRLNKVLAIELLAKLFYLEDIEHEIEERSTSVQHSLLINSVSLAIGDTARREQRAQLRTASAPTDSFVSFWDQCNVQMRGLDEQNHTFDLAIAESQTRLVAWRLAPSGATSSWAISPATHEAGETSLQRDSVTTQTFEYLLYLDIWDSTGQVSQDLDPKPRDARLRKYKSNLDEVLQRLSIAATAQKAEAFLWRHSGDSAYVFIGGKSALQHAVSSANEILRTTARSETPHVRLYVVPCAIAGTTVYRISDATEVYGQRFWESWARLLKAASKLEAKTPWTSSFLLVASPELIRHFDADIWRDPKDADIALTLDLLERSVRIRFGFTSEVGD